MASDNTTYMANSICSDSGCADTSQLLETLNETKYNRRKTWFKLMG